MFAKENCFILYTHTHTFFIFPYTFRSHNNKKKTFSVPFFFFVTRTPLPHNTTHLLFTFFSFLFYFIVSIWCVHSGRIGWLVFFLWICNTQVYPYRTPGHIEFSFRCPHIFVKVYIFPVQINTQIAQTFFFVKIKLHKSANRFNWQIKNCLLMRIGIYGICGWKEYKKKTYVYHFLCMKEFLQHTDGWYIKYSIAGKCCVSLRSMVSKRTVWQSLGNFINKTKIKIFWGNEWICVWRNDDERHFGI